VDVSVSMELGFVLVGNSSAAEGREREAVLEALRRVSSQPVANQDKDCADRTASTLQVVLCHRGSPLGTARPESASPLGLPPGLEGSGEWSEVLHLRTNLSFPLRMRETAAGMEYWNGWETDFTVSGVVFVRVLEGIPSKAFDQCASLSVSTALGSPEALAVLQDSLRLPPPPEPSETHCPQRALSGHAPPVLVDVTRHVVDSR
jgi:hypothetical protein